jgi:6-phosphogluconolactonase
MKLMLCLLAVMLSAAPPTQPPAADTAVREVVRAYLDARDRADAAAVKALFTEDADQLTSSGEWRRGQAALVTGTLASSKGNPGARSISIETVRFPAPGVAVADGRYEITGGGNERRMWTSFLLVHGGDRWRIAAIRNMLPAPQPGSAAPAAAADATLVYVGTYTRGKSRSQGIYAYRLDAASQTLVPVGLAAESPNPSFLEIDRARGLLFAVNEVDEFDGKSGGAVSAFSIDRTTGKLTLINQQASMGRGPCHLVLDKSGRYLLVANYGSGTVAAVPVAADGRLGPASAVVQHTGSSVNPERQKGPHAHCMALDAANRFAFACDLGLDKVLTYRFDADKGTLQPHDRPFTALQPGAGPRHMAFTPDGRHAYVLNEMHSTVTAFAYDASAGVLKELQTLPTIPPGFTGQNSGAEIAVHPSGKFVYASNRGHDSIAVFTIDGSKGTLTLVANEPIGGRTPRHFGIDPAGEWITVAGQASDTLLTARIDPATGRFKPAPAPVTAPTPVFVGFLPPNGR